MSFSDIYEKLLEVNPAVWGAIIALVAIGVGTLIIFRGKQRWTTQMLVNASMSIAVAFVLSCIRLYRMPQGGSITPASTLPILMFAYAYGFGPGLLVGTAYGLLQLLQDAYFVHPIQLLLDYPLAFGMLALTGLVRETKYNRFSFALFCLLAGAGRALMHIISGAIFFWEYANGANPWLYSIQYNFFASYIDAIVCAVIVALPPVAKMIENWRGRIRKQQAIVNGVG